MQAEQVVDESVSCNEYQEANTEDVLDDQCSFPEMLTVQEISWQCYNQ